MSSSAPYHSCMGIHFRRIDAGHRGSRLGEKDERVRSEASAFDLAAGHRCLTRQSLRGRYPEPNLTAAGGSTVPVKGEGILK